MKYVYKDDMILPYHIEYKRIKHTYFRIKNDHVYVTTNKMIKEAQIIKLLLEKFDVLYDRINHRPRFMDNQIRLWQKSYQLVIEKGPFKYEINDDQVICYTQKKDVDTIRKLIYLSEMKRMVHQLRDQILITLNKVDIPELTYKYKYLRSKFGSYHKRHLEITLNTFLATLDPIFLEYVIYHEYAHHKVFNHSKAFYQVLDQMMPNHKNIQKTLKKMEII